MSKKIAQYASRVQMDKDASTMAEFLAYNIWRALNDGKNINTYDPEVEYAGNKLLSDLNTALDNGDIASSVFSYATDGRTIIGRPKFTNGLFGNKQGVILMGGNLSQEMLTNYNLEGSMNDKKYVGTNYKGNVMQFNIVMAPDYIWSLAETYLNLAPGAFNNITAIACSYEATATANNIDLGVKIIDAQNPRGALAQPLNIWGHEAFRKSQIIGDATLTTAYLNGLGFTDSDRRYPIAPQQASLNAFDKITVPVFDDAGNITAYREVAKVPQPNGGGIAPTPSQVVLPVINTTTASAIAITTTTSGAKIYYTTDGSEPSVLSALYKATFAGTSGITIKAIAVKDGMATSGIATKKVA